MEEHIDEIRQKELVLLKKSFLVRNVMDSFNTASPFLVSNEHLFRCSGKNATSLAPASFQVALFSFGTYVLSSPEHELTPQVI